MTDTDMPMSASVARSAARNPTSVSPDLGRLRAGATGAGHCAALLVDASRNPAMAYHDVVRLRLCNNTRKRAAGDNPPDGAKTAARHLDGGSGAAGGRVAQLRP